MPHWTKKFFIDEEKYWHALMDAGWKQAPAQARAIAKILKRNGIKHGQVLELCCGNGRISTNLAKQGYRVTGIDLSPAYIEDAKKRARKIGVRPEYVCGDVRRFNRLVKGKFDAVYTIWTAIGYYDRKTDERIFKMVARRLYKNGLFMILQTMSREWLLNHYCHAIYDETDKYLILHRGKFDRIHSQNIEHWYFYEKRGKDLKFVTDMELPLRIYSQHEITEMAEGAGLKFTAAFNNLLLLNPPDPVTPQINMVFQKP